MKGEILKDKLLRDLGGSVSWMYDSDFSSDHDLKVMGSSPVSRFTLSSKSAWKSLFLPHCSLLLSLLRKKFSLENFRMMAN